MNQFYQTTFVITEKDVGKKLQHFIQSALKESVSLKKIKLGLENNGCIVNGKIERFASYRLCKGDHIQFIPELFLKSRESSQFSKEAILYEDNDILVYNKPSGVSSEEGGLFTLIQKYYPTLEKVHRLDKETSGAILFAKSRESQKILIDFFKNKKIYKEYLAIVDGIPHKKEDIIEQSMGKIKKIQGQSIWGPLSISKGGKEAITFWKLLAKSKDASLLICKPITGRTHQIRVHLQYLGNPILGDKLYRHKNLCKYPAERHFLHAYKLFFPKLDESKEIRVTASPPLDMIQAMFNIFNIDFFNENFDH